MTMLQLLEVAAAVLLLGGGVWLQVKSKREDARHGSQGAVILIMIGAIVAIHGLGLMEYRPSRAEMERAAARVGNQ
jgi:hypothetical protein